MGSLVFIKDMAAYIVPNGSTISSFVWPKELDDFQHTFLIRSPRLQVPSLVKRMQEDMQKYTVAEGAPVKFDIAEVGVQQLHTLFHAVLQRTNTTPVLIDAGDMFRDPAATLSEYCNRIGVKFEDTMLHWKSGWRPEFGYDDIDDEWVHDLLNSTGFRKG